MSERATPGMTIEGKYRLERQLGSGGMGSVWLANQVMVDRDVAVKLLHPAFLDQEDLQARFEVEAKAIGRLNHPNCITLFDFGYSEDLQAFYTVIEYIQGESLDRRLTGRMPLKDVVSIIRQIAKALDHAHHKGILHRDLKPENIMLSSMTDGSEMVKVLDFGIARIVKGEDIVEEESHRITKAGEVFGTPAYMSPEQARSIRKLSSAADLYSLGVIFYELVAGSLPFFANSAFDLLMLHVTKPVPPIARQDVPEVVKEIIYKLLEKDPEARFQKGQELIAALDAIPQALLETPEEDFEAAPTQFSEREPNAEAAAALATLESSPETLMLDPPRGHETLASMPIERKRTMVYTTGFVLIIVFLAIGVSIALVVSDSSASADQVAVEAPRDDDVASDITTSLQEDEPEDETLEILAEPAAEPQPEVVEDSPEPEPTPAAVEKRPEPQTKPKPKPRTTTRPKTKPREAPEAKADEPSVTRLTLGDSANKETKSGDRNQDSQPVIKLDLR